MLKKFYFGFLAANKSIQIAAFLHQPPFTFSFFQKKVFNRIFLAGGGSSGGKGNKNVENDKTHFHGYRFYYN